MLLYPEKKNNGFVLFKKYFVLKLCAPPLSLCVCMCLCVGKKRVSESM